MPAGFFADKAADAKARGVKLPNAKDKEDEFQVNPNKTGKPGGRAPG